MLYWHEKYATGQPLLDADHKVLFAQVNALAAARKAGLTREPLEQMIVFLSLYARAHFTREEQVMLKTKCPVSGQNCAAHKEFATKLDGWTKQLVAQVDIHKLAAAVEQETTSWLSQHIVAIDCQLRGCVKKAKRG